MSKFLADCVGLPGPPNFKTDPDQKSALQQVQNTQEILNIIFGIFGSFFVC
jgi:hypothetical protein